MTNEQPTSVKETALSGGVHERLTLFAEWTGTKPPEKLTEGAGDERTFSDDLLMFCHETGLSLDWVWLGDEKSLVLQAFNAAQGGQA